MCCSHAFRLAAFLFVSVPFNSIRFIIIFHSKLIFCWSVWCICTNSCELNCTSNSMLVYKYGPYTAHTCTTSSRSIDFRGNFWHIPSQSVNAVCAPRKIWWCYSLPFCWRHRQHEFVVKNIFMYVEQLSTQLFRKYFLIVCVSGVLVINAHLANLIMLRWFGLWLYIWVSQKLSILRARKF